MSCIEGSEKKERKKLDYEFSREMGYFLSNFHNICSLKQKEWYQLENLQKPKVQNVK